MISREVLLLILNKFHKDQMFSILADETSDISCKEQLSFCLRYVDDNFDCCEEFVGLYQLDSCQAEYIHTAVDDILVRCQISWKDCRGLAFDGAANMAGIRNGVAARIQQHYPKALFAYCHMHCLNLCVKDTVSDAVPLMRDFFSNILELTSFIRHSPKRMAHLRHINSEQEDSQIQSLRPLCPTRMTVKYNTLTAIDSQASSLMQILDDIRSDRTSTHEAQAKASGLLRWLESFEFSFAQTIGLELFGMTDELSKQLQNPKLSAAEGLESVLALKMLINTKRTDMHFESIWRDVEARRDRFNGAQAKLPRMRHAPMRFEDGGRAVEFESVDQYFRVQYYLVLDKVTASICERFESSAWKIMHCMETVLVQSCRGEDPLLRDIETILVHASGDLDKDLVGQLSQLRNIPMSTEERNGMTSFSDILKLLKKERALLRLLPQVVKLVKLVCILPCSTATPERSFSQLRRIKNYMRSTVTQERLNHTMIAAVHCDKLDNIDINKVMNEFIMRNEHRRATFAKL